jgi:nucleoside-diphosphate-sugar epimerase
MGRKALITGATGFVGRNLVEQLDAYGWRIRAMVRPGSSVEPLRQRGAELYVGDLREPESLPGAFGDADTVYHLGAVTAARTEAEYRQANADGTRALIAALLAANPRPRRLVYLSSYAAGGPGTHRSCHEASAPLTAYGRTKLSGEQAVLEAEGIEIVVIRAPVVYGPGDRALLPLFRLIRWGLAPAPGGGDRKLHLVFAPDLAAALRRAADAPAGAFAVADPVEHGWREVSRIIGRRLGRRPLPVPLPAPLVRAAAAITESTGRLAGRAVPFNREKAEEMLASAWIHDLAGSELLLPLEEVTPLERGIDYTVRWYLGQGWL